MVADELGLVAHQDELEEDISDCSYGPNGDQKPFSTGSIIQLYLACLVAALGGLLFGYDVGVIAGARSMVAQDMDLTCSEEELVVSLMPLGAVSASIVSGWLMNNVGRKYTIQLTSFVFVLGAVSMGAANSLTALLVGRFLVGFGVSLSAMSECTYISEIAVASLRGRLVTLNELGITMGFLFAFVVNYIFMTVESGWRYMFGLSGIVAAVQFVLLTMLPKTPHFLVMSGKEEEAIQVLKKMHGLGGVASKRAISSIKAARQDESGLSCTFLFSTTDNMRSRLVVGLGLVVAQQVTGQPNIMYYAMDIARSVGFCGDLLSASATVLLGIVKVLATVLAMLLVDRVGRRSLLLSGIAMLTVSLSCLMITSTYQHHISGHNEHQICVDHDVKLLNSTEMTYCSLSTVPHTIRYLSFAALISSITAYSVSFGPITWILLAELYPLHMKSHAMSLGQAVNWTVNVLVSVTFLDMVNILSLPVVFAVYFTMGSLSLLFVYFYVPETKNKTLEEISSHLKQSSPNKHKTFSPMAAVKTQPRRDNIFVPLHQFDVTKDDACKIDT